MARKGANGLTCPTALFAPFWTMTSPAFKSTNSSSIRSAVGGLQTKQSLTAHSHDTVLSCCCQSKHGCPCSLDGHSCSSFNRNVIREDMHCCSVKDSRLPPGSCTSIQGNHQCTFKQTCLHAQLLVHKSLCHAVTPSCIETETRKLDCVVKRAQPVFLILVPLLPLHFLLLQAKRA